MEYHEIANLFPLMVDKDFDDLVADIKDNGLSEPICTYQGKILDGRNRELACKAANVTPAYVEYRGDNPVKHVVSMNLHRRHLTGGQRAAIGVEVERLESVYAKERRQEGNRKGGVESGKSRRGETKSPDILPETSKKHHGHEARERAAAVVGASGRRIQDAKKVAKEDPVLFEQVKAGTVTLADAFHEVKEKEQEKEQEKNPGTNSMNGSTNGSTTTAHRTAPKKKNNKRLPQHIADPRSIEMLSRQLLDMSRLEKWQLGMKELQRVAEELYVIVFQHAPQQETK